MNLILIEPAELRDGVATLCGRRARHIVEVHRAGVGDALRVGVVGGLIGTGTVQTMTDSEVVFEVALDLPPPPPLGIDLLLAMPRPKILRKVLPAAASMGVKRIVLVNAARVEKSYFDSPLLDAGRLRETLLAGLEQSRDTVLPDVYVRGLFRPFVEDEVTEMWPAAARVVAHPDAHESIEGAGALPGNRRVVAIGPEGGWVPFEVNLLERQGFRPFSLGPRILRVDTAVPVIVGQLDLLRRTARAAREDATSLRR